MWPKREDYHGDGSRLSSEHTPVANPINPSHILAPDPNKIEKAKKGSNKYLSAISVACEEIEERKKAREKAISTMSDGGRKRLKFASNGWLNCQIEFRQKNNKMIKAFVHRYSIKRKKWLLTIEGGPKGGSKDKGGKGNATQRSNTQGQVRSDEEPRTAGAKDGWSDVRAAYRPPLKLTTLCSSLRSLPPLTPRTLHHSGWIFVILPK